ncbi:apolipoprotein D and lipocalin family protein [Paraburkholderia atlantica]|uniref:lipocalin family protein n=1 Tax=Paraburkholderia atlantica TaxID=2654982 RepID=UPI00037D6514|nr:lipocalin [Paraburkholderia atlantica]NUY35302.1 lipocalin family protein [Paraburkholderia atlantica]
MQNSIACLTAIAACLTGCAHIPAASPQTPGQPTACVAGPPIDLQRYMGKWFVIAETPYLGDNDYVGSYDEWTLRADGQITDDYRGRRHSFDQPVTGSHFVAKVVGGTGNTTWRVGLIWPFEVRVVTAYVDPEYHHTIRCMVDSNMVWVLSRSPTMDEETYLDLIARLAGMGFNVQRIRQVPQDAGQTSPAGSE